MYVIHSVQLKFFFDSKFVQFRLWEIWCIVQVLRIIVEKFLTRYKLSIKVFKLRNRADSIENERLNIDYSH